MKVSKKECEKISKRRKDSNTQSTQIINALKKQFTSGRDIKYNTCKRIFIMTLILY